MNADAVPVDNLAVPENNGRLPGTRRKRGRVSTACSQCHSRKQKCNNERPCLNCLRRGIPELCRSATDVEQAVRKRQQVSEPARQADETILENDSFSVETEASPVFLTHPVPSAPQFGQLWNSRGAPTFYGNSYFGPQVAARIIEGQELDLPAGDQQTSASSSFRTEAGAFAQLWDLLGMLPRQKSRVDRLTDKFLTELNWSIDAVHPATFRHNYDRFWERKSGFEDVTTVDLRWLALLFAILAFAELLDCPQPCSTERQHDCGESSLRFYWASRRAIVIAPSFYGESSDLVRAGILITRYLIYSRRLSESWLTIGFASRIAMAQGIHVDGERWKLPRKATETRRRLWSHLYSLDKMISLALGRPCAIAEKHCLTKEVTNIWVDDMTNEEAAIAQPQSLDDPTPSVMIMLNYSLAKIIGRIQDECFGLDPPIYDTVVSLDRELLKWARNLPSYYSLQDPDLSLEGDQHLYLKWHRLYLHTNYHFARIQLHQPYLLRHSITNRYQYSRNACMDSATIDLQTRLSEHNIDLVEKFQWGLGAHQLFNSALVLGIIAVKSPYSQETMAILEDLEEYCEKQVADSWMNEFGLAEVRVIQLCIKHTKRMRDQGRRRQDMAVVPAFNYTQQSQHDWRYGPTQHNNASTMSTKPPPTALTPTSLDQQYMPSYDTSATDPWPDPFCSFPDSGNLRVWEEIISDISTNH